MARRPSEAGKRQRGPAAPVSGVDYCCHNAAPLSSLPPPGPPISFGFAGFGKREKFYIEIVNKFLLSFQTDKSEGGC